MCAGTREDGTTIDPNDPFWGDLHATAHTARTRPAAWREQRAIYGTLADDPRFATAFDTWVQLIWQEGARAALVRYNAAD